MKPRIFIGSSAESKSVAYAVQQNLEDDAEPTVWDQDVFEPSGYALDTLTNALTRFDFGIFVFSPDDVTKLRGNDYVSVRDNVVFEVGMFIGSLGRLRTFLIVPKGISNLRIPTDLLGLTLLSFIPDRQDGNMRAALAPACQQISQALRRFSSESPVSLAPERSDTFVASGTPKLNLAIPERIMLGHRFGDFGIMAFLNISNTGRGSATVTRARCIVHHESGTAWELAAISFVSRQPPQQPNQSPLEFPFFNIVIKPDESWSENVRFIRQWSDKEEDEAKLLAFNTQRYVFENQQTPGVQLQVSKELYAEAVGIFRRNFNLSPGAYSFIVTIEAEPGSLLVESGFGFSLSSGSIEAAIKVAEEGYRFGAGTYFPNNNPAGIMWPTVHPIEKPVTREGGKSEALPTKNA